MATTSPDASCGARAATIESAFGMQLGGRSGSVEGADDLFGIEPLGFGNALLLVNAGEHHAIGETQARDELVGEHLAAQRVGARFEHGPEPRLRINGAERAESFANGGGVVREVLNERDAGDLGRALQDGALRF